MRFSPNAPRERGRREKENKRERGRRGKKKRAKIVYQRFNFTLRIACERKSCIMHESRSFGKVLSGPLVRRALHLEQNKCTSTAITTGGGLEGKEGTVITKLSVERDVRNLRRSRRGHAGRAGWLKKYCWTIPDIVAN